MVWDSTWDAVFERQEWGKYPSESLIRFVARNFYKKQRSTVRILELGCGPGANIWYLARERFRAYGIDGSAIAIARGKKRLVREKLKAELRTGDILELPYPDQFFDAVVDVECLSCNSFDDSAAILAEAHRVLKPSGLLFSQCFTDRTTTGASKKRADLSYKSVKVGPLAGIGFVRLTDRRAAKKLYGQHFAIRSLDLLEFTSSSSQLRVSEWIVVGERRS